MNDADLGHLGWAFRSVRRHDEIHPGATQSNQFAQSLDSASGARSSDRMKTESLDDARDDLSVLMLTDQDMRLSAPIRKRHHELTGMPKCKDEPGAFTMQPIDLLLTFGFNAHGSPKASDR